MKEVNKLEFIYWFAFYNLNSASVRYRAKYPLDYLKKNHNINSYLIIPSYTSRGIYSFFRAYLSAILYCKPNSLIVIQRVQSHFVYAFLLKLLVLVRKRNTIYDLDDADYLDVNPSTIYFFSKKCEIISAGSKKIAEHLKQFNKYIIHTTSPVVDLGITKISKNSLFNIGWIGDFKGDHRESLIQFIFPALRSLSFNFKFTIVGIEQAEDLKFIQSYFADLQNVKIDAPMRIDWNDEKYLQSLIVNFDIGIATLLNNEMQISKSGIKAKQYLNNGIPVLSTMLPENDWVVQHGYNGYFCSDAIEFEERLNEFYNMPESEYLVYSKNSRSSNKNFNLQVFCSKLEKMKTLLLMFPLAFLATISMAIGVMRHDVKEESYINLAHQKQFDCIGHVYKDTAGSGSCILISSKYVLSAAHVFIDYDFHQDTMYVNGQTIIAFVPGNPRMTSPSSIHIEFNGELFNVKNVILHPSYLDSLSTGSCDLAIIELEKPVLSINPATLNTTFDELNAEVVGVGYGSSGPADKPNLVVSENKKIAGENVVDSLAGQEYMGKQTLMICDFDHPKRKDCNKTGNPNPMKLEYICSGGDSGGGLFRLKNNQWELIGVCTGTDIDITRLSDTGYYGNTMEWTRVSAFTDWIHGQMKN